MTLSSAFRFPEGRRFPPPFRLAFLARIARLPRPCDPPRSEPQRPVSQNGDLLRSQSQTASAIGSDSPRVGFWASGN